MVIIGGGQGRVSSRAACLAVTNTLHLLSPTKVRRTPIQQIFRSRRTGRAPASAITVYPTASGSANCQFVWRRTRTSPAVNPSILHVVAFWRLDMDGVDAAPQDNGAGVRAGRRVPQDKESIVQRGAVVAQLDTAQVLGAPRSRFRRLAVPDPEIERAEIDQFVVAAGFADKVGTRVERSCRTSPCPPESAFP